MARVGVVSPCTTPPIIDAFICPPDHVHIASGENTNPGFQCDRGRHMMAYLQAMAVMIAESTRSSNSRMASIGEWEHRPWSLTSS